MADSRRTTGARASARGRRAGRPEAAAKRDRGVREPTESETTPPLAHLLILSERAALAWVLSERRMAFPAHRAAEARALPLGHRLFLYTTRGCFHNPTRDRGRVIGSATLTSRVADLAQPVHLAGRTFTVGCRLAIPKLVPCGAGVELAPLVQNLATFPNKPAWSARMRQTLVSVAAGDVAVLDGLLAPLLVPRTRALDSYVAAVPTPPTAGAVTK